MLSRQANGKGGAGAIHVLACVAGEAGDLEVIRRGRALADQLGGRITVLHAFALGEEPQRRTWLAQDRSLARTLQTPLVEVPAYSTIDGIVEYAESRRVTHLVLGDEIETHRPAVHHGALVEQLAGRLGPIDLYLVP